MFARMHEEVDRALLAAVESTAQELADDIKQGRTDLANIDLESIGALPRHVCA